MESSDTDTKLAIIETKITINENAISDVLFLKLYFSSILKSISNKNLTVTCCYETYT